MTVVDVQLSASAATSMRAVWVSIWPTSVGLIGVAILASRRRFR